jgi:transposase
MQDRLNRHDLSDEEWQRLRVFLPCGPQQRGGRWADHRTVINGIFFRALAGCPWRDLPAGFVSVTWNQIFRVILSVRSRR